jgi:predicted RNA-binding protein YlqC (UPF0109 family)
MAEQSVDVRRLIEEVVKSLVDEPAQVSVNQLDGETTVLELAVAEGDVGKVIGRQGRVARALRALLSAAGICAHKRFDLEIVE